MTTLSTRGLWLAWTLMLSTITGLAGGALASLGGANPADAIVAGAVAFGGTTGLTLLIISFLAPNPPPARRRGDDA